MNESRVTKDRMCRWCEVVAEGEAKELKEHFKRCIKKQPKTDKYLEFIKNGGM